MGGRRPKPTALRILQGNTERRPLNDAEPKVPLGAPERPIGMDRCARREWAHITQDLAVAGLLAKTDGKALMGYCIAFSDVEKAERLCQKYGLVIQEEGAFGPKWKAGPWVAVKNAALGVMKAYLIEFGLTPASRARLKVEKPKSDPEGDAMLSRDAAKQQKDAEAAAEDKKLLDSIPDTFPDEKLQ